MFCLTIAFIETEWGQNWVAKQITGRLSKDLRTKININHVSFTLFNRMDLKGVYVEDQNKDTLLSAGLVRVRITDWFFFKDTADLKYIGLKNAVVNFNRTDSIWNYNFLSDYFSSPSGKPKKKKAGIKFHLKKIVLDNVAFIQKDAWLGSNLAIKVGGADFNVNDLSISEQLVNLDGVTLDTPYFSTYSYTGKYKPKKTTSNDHWKVLVNTIDVNDGRFILNNRTETATVKYFDSRHIDFSRLNAAITNFQLRTDTITANIKLSARERSGLVVRKLNTDFTMLPSGLIFKNLTLQTNRSTLGPYFAMRYKSIKSLDNFIHEVTLDANFHNSILSSDDIALFAPGINSWKKSIRINGHVKGTVDGLSANNLDLWAGNNSHLRGNVSLVGLPDINKTLINVEAQQLQTNYADMVSFIPSLKNIETPNLKRLSYINFTGTYTGFINDFVSYGTIQTSLGALTTDIHMKFPSRGEPSYSGKISTAGFQLGQFVNSSHLGIVDFNGTVAGKGFNWKTMDMKINGVVRRFRYDDYVYQNITANGTFNKRKFNGEFTIKDPNADARLNGLIDLSGRKPLFDATAEVVKANLKELQLTKDDIRLSGNFKLNMQGSNIADILGNARISNANVYHNGTRLSFDSLNVYANYINGVRTLRVRSNEFDATVTGNFDLASLPNAFTLFLNRYYPSYIKVPAHVKPQKFTFDITTGSVEDYVKLIDPNLSGFNNSHIVGSLDVSANNMTIDADVPQFGYKKYQFSNVQVNGRGDFQKLILTGKVLDAVIDSNVIFPQTTFTIEAQNDISNINIKTTSNQAINQADLSAQIKTFSDGASVIVNPSTFVLNGKTWTIEQGGELNFRRNTVVQGQLVLKESQQQIVVQTVPSAIGNWNDLHISLQNLYLGDLTPLLTKSERIEGALSGDIIIEDPTQKFNVTTNLQGSEMRFNNDSIGQVVIGLNYNGKTGLLTGRGNNLDTEHKIDFDISLKLRDTTNFQNRITLRPQNFQIKFLENYLGTIVSNMQGYASGEVNIVGDGKHQDYLAKVHLHDAGFTVNFTNVAYRIEDTDVELKKDLIEINNVRLQDRLGGKAVANGTIQHHGFKDMKYDISVVTTTPSVEILNTTYKENQTFYGHVFGTASFTLIGREDDLFMDVNIKGSETNSTRDSSYVTLPPSRSRETGQAQFMVEKKYGREMTTSELRGTGTNLTYNIHMIPTPKVNVEVILDELTGDVIRGKGTGDLTITSGTSAPLTLNGQYNIDEGNYLFTFQAVFKKPFVLRKGANNYIKWERDPYDAKVHLEALYTAEKVNYAPLASRLTGCDDQEVLTNLGRMRENVNVAATLTGDLFHPNFNFKLEFPSNTQITNHPCIAFGIQQIENNLNDMNKQVTYLIVMNSFAPVETSQSLLPFEELTYNTFSGLFFNVLNNQINQALSKVLSSNKLTLNFSGSLYNPNLVNPNARGIQMFNQLPSVASNISLGRSFFNNRAIFTVGGTFDLPLQNNLQQSIQLLPDVTLEILLNQTGTVRATFFYRQNIDYLYGNPTTGSPTTKRYGTSLSYNKEFDNIWEFIFGRKNKKPTVDTLPPVSVTR